VTEPEHLAQEIVLREGRVALGQLGARKKCDSCGLHFALELVPACLLGLHQAARVFIDQVELLGRAAAVVAGHGLAGPDKFAQARDAHRIEFIEIGCRNGQEPQAFKQRNAGIARLVENPPVERQPA